MYGFAQASDSTEIMKGIMDTEGIILSKNNIASERHLWNYTYVRRELDPQIIFPFCFYTEYKKVAG